MCIRDSHVVSILGARLTETQANLLVNCSNEVILALDADEAGQRGMEKAKGLLSSRLMTRFANIGSIGKKDFGECSPTEILSVIESSHLL